MQSTQLVPHALRSAPSVPTLVRTCVSPSGRSYSSSWCCFAWLLKCHRLPRRTVSVTTQECTRCSTSCAYKLYLHSNCFGVCCTSAWLYWTLSCFNYMLGFSTAMAYVPVYWRVLLLLLSTGIVSWQQMDWVWIGRKTWFVSPKDTSLWLGSTMFRFLFVSDLLARFGCYPLPVLPSSLFMVFQIDLSWRGRSTQRADHWRRHHVASCYRIGVVLHGLALCIRAEFAYPRAALTGNGRFMRSWHFLFFWLDSKMPAATILRNVLVV